MTAYANCTLLLLLGAALVSARLPAAPVRFSGTLNDPPPCTVNNDQNVVVDFGDSLGVRKVDGSNYRKPVPYSLTCGPDSPQSGLRLVLTAGSSGQANFDASAVNSSTPGLAIRLLADGDPVRFDHPYPVSVASPPVLEAVPVKQSGAALAEGAFTAAATLQVDYQ